MGIFDYFTGDKIIGKDEFNKIFVTNFNSLFSYILTKDFKYTTDHIIPFRDNLGVSYKPEIEEILAREINNFGIIILSIMTNINYEDKEYNFYVKKNKYRISFEKIWNEKLFNYKEIKSKKNINLFNMYKNNELIMSIDSRMYEVLKGIDKLYVNVAEPEIKIQRIAPRKKKMFDINILNDQIAAITKNDINEIKSHFIDLCHKRENL